MTLCLLWYSGKKRNQIKQNLLKSKLQIFYSYTLESKYLLTKTLLLSILKAPSLPPSPSPPPLEVDAPNPLSSNIFFALNPVGIIEIMLIRNPSRQTRHHQWKNHPLITAIQLSFHFLWWSLSLIAWLPISSNMEISSKYSFWHNQPSLQASLHPQPSLHPLHVLYNHHTSTISQDNHGNQLANKTWLSYFQGFEYKTLSG